ncbi:MULTISPECIES: LysR substrate-binding domain-containing protein [unclassified Roseivivax]|uniref:LysR substrate-binding domain-containing protein n=1 Tax=Roseivivax sp. GX 12232 TaxID=2900547 RepID=UPI001E557854|nr:LysR substrate-binding domain-containing protein [Roseivivax sp. GX 12232]MCE0504757.1 LysR substrate-binding domain-containing protein [Roseivivax sp. GX 12232]
MQETQASPLSRRLLPPLPALRALEALDRLGTAAAVARELDLSQSAISRQIRTLEDQLGVSLVSREGRALALTPEARGYATEVRAALNRIAQASLSLRMPSRAGSLSLAILPSFGMRWLVPRLPDFTRRHPEVTINFTTRLRPPDFDAEGFDAAIEYGTDARPGTQRLMLRPERVMPVAAPGVLPQGPVSLRVLATLPLLHIDTRPKAWESWFAAQGMQTGALPGTSFDQFTTILEAALHGLGVALLPDYLSEEDRARGRLVLAAEAEPASLGAYHLAWPDSRPVTPALAAFRDWLANAGQPEDDPLPR